MRFTSTFRKAGLELVPGIRLMVPVCGQMYLAPVYSRKSRTASCQPLGAPFTVGSWVRLRCVLPSWYSSLYIWDQLQTA